MPEFSPCLTMRFAQVFFWMTLAGKCWIMPPHPELSLPKGAYTTEEIFFGTRLLWRIQTCLA